MIKRCFGVQIHYKQSKWIVIDGKALRGTLDAGVYTLVDSGEMSKKDTIGSAHRGIHYFS
ncbi:MAG: hypothetical protein RQ733_00500 [Methyloprofundus sp.]|nr:hypothetical protein [Methyloprofundus sp.]MDT8424433.1 hypothetical protein [Methyloprofundus sp.]